MRHRYREFTTLLTQGWPILKAASKLGISKPTAYRWAHRAVEDKLIDPACAWPLLFRKARKNETQVNLVGKFSFSSPKDPLFIPHKYGGSFLQTGRPQGLKYDSRGRAFHKEGSHTAQFGRSKAVIWIKHFRGSSAKEIEKNAFEDILRLAGHYSLKYGIALTLQRVFNGVEWVLVDREASAKSGEMLGIKKGEQKEIAMTTFKIDKSSHPDLLEINQAPGQPAYLPTQHVHTLEYLLLNAPLLLKEIVDASVKMNERLKKLEGSK